MTYNSSLSPRCHSYGGLHPTMDKEEREYKGRRGEREEKMKTEENEEEVEEEEEEEEEEISGAGGRGRGGGGGGTGRHPGDKEIIPTSHVSLLVRLGSPMGGTKGRKEPSKTTVEEKERKHQAEDKHKKTKGKDTHKLW